MTLQSYSLQIPDRPLMRLQCHYLDRENPFLKLGPFMYEPLNDIPHVAIIRDFAYKNELEQMKNQVHSFS